MQYDKVRVEFRAVAIMGALQIINIIYAILKMKTNYRLIPTMIKQLSEDDFICKSDTTIMYYLMSELHSPNFINTILIIGIVIALIFYFIITKNTSSIVLIYLNIALCSITVVPYLMVESNGMITRLAVYDLAYFTASYQNVPLVIVVYTVLLAAYAWFLLSYFRKNSKLRIDGSQE